MAAVDGNGKVTPVGTGSAEITLTSDNGTKGTCQVTVTAPAEGITLSDKTLTLAIDSGAHALTWTFSPQGSGGELVWTSDNVHVAKVDQKGVVTPLSVGETDIRVKNRSECNSCVPCSGKRYCKGSFCSRNADCESMQGFRKYSNDYLG